MKFITICQDDVFGSVRQFKDGKWLDQGVRFGVDTLKDLERQKIHHQVHFATLPSQVKVFLGDVLCPVTEEGVILTPVRANYDTSD